MSIPGSTTTVPIKILKIVVLVAWHIIVTWIWISTWARFHELSLFWNLKVVAEQWPKAESWKATVKDSDWYWSSVLAIASCIGGSLCELFDWEPWTNLSWRMDTRCTHETVENWHPLCYYGYQIALNTAHLNAPLHVASRHELSGLANDNDAGLCINCTRSERWPVVSELLGDTDELPTVIPPWLQCGTVGWGRRNLQHRSPFAVASGLWDWKRPCCSVRALECALCSGKFSFSSYESLWRWMLAIFCGLQCKFAVQSCALLHVCSLSELLRFYLSRCRNCHRWRHDGYHHKQATSQLTESILPVLARSMKGFTDNPGRFLKWCYSQARLFLHALPVTPSLLHTLYECVW